MREWKRANADLRVQRAAGFVAGLGDLGDRLKSESQLSKPQS